MNNVILSSTERTQLNSHLANNKLPDGYRHLKSIVDSRISAETNTANQEGLRLLSNWLQNAADINSGNGSFKSEFVYHATNSFSLLENGVGISRERFQEVSNELAKDVFDTFLKGEANFENIINKDVQYAVEQFSLPRWGWAGTLGDKLPIALLGLGKDVVNVDGASTFEYLANLSKAFAANGYGLAAAPPQAVGKFVGQWLYESKDAISHRLDLYDKATELYFNSARQQGDASPLILDLDGDGVETIGINDSYAYFDHNHDGFAERTGWAGADDGILVRDLNGNGQIDNGGELFGDNTLVNGARAVNGFEALKALDTNQDGQFNNVDTTWNSVKVWKDSNSNTQVDSGEMLTLAQANVASIDLGYYNNYGYGLEANGNDHREVSYFQDTSGNYKSISDVWFKANRTDSVDTVQVPINATIQGLFELRSTGTLVSLHKAMALDTTGSLQAFVSQLQTKLDGGHTVAQLHQDTRQLLLKWASAENLPAEVYDTGSDAREIAVLEKVPGISFKEAA